MKFDKNDFNFDLIMTHYQEHQYYYHHPSFHKNITKAPETNIPFYLKLITKHPLSIILMFHFSHKKRITDKK